MSEHFGDHVTSPQTPGIRKDLAAMSDIDGYPIPNGLTRTSRLHLATSWVEGFCLRRLILAYSFHYLSSLCVGALHPSSDRRTQHDSFQLDPLNIPRAQSQQSRLHFRESRSHRSPFCDIPSCSETPRSSSLLIPHYCKVDQNVITIRTIFPWLVSANIQRGT